MGAKNFRPLSAIGCQSMSQPFHDQILGFIFRLQYFVFYILQECCLSLCERVMFSYASVPRYYFLVISVFQNFFFHVIFGPSQGRI